MRCDECDAVLTDLAVDVCGKCCPPEDEEPHTAADADIDRLILAGRFRDAEYVATGG